MGFSKILVANRGEIAMRVMRAARDLGIPTVAVHSTVDRDSPHVRLADEAFCIGPAASAESYLDIPSLLSVCEVTGADAVHPGYGFLSENAQFAELCGVSGITWIGPPPSAIQAMGDKIRARELMQEAGVPILPGTPGAIEDVEEAIGIAKAIGFPMILKAAAGGGGRGMKVVESADQLEQAWLTCSAEAQAAFGSGAVYMERYLRTPRHVEFQVVLDQYGSGVHLFERECSVQRRHQKLIEEAPCVVLDEATRARLGALCVEASQRIGYVGVGTFEFLHDSDGSLYFMEMNTRIQVEHPVTEMITGVDLVKLQIDIARGAKLPFDQAGVPGPMGHAMEFRINAETPDRFLPSPGTIRAYEPAGGPGIRVDGVAHAGYTVLPHYDSMVAKLIVHGADRQECMARAKRALHEFRIEGIATTIPFHQRVLQHAAFSKGDYDTHLVATM